MLSVFGTGACVGCGVQESDACCGVHYNTVVGHSIAIQTCLPFNFSKCSSMLTYPFDVIQIKINQFRVVTKPNDTQYGNLDLFFLASFLMLTKH